MIQNFFVTKVREKQGLWAKPVDHEQSMQHYKIYKKKWKHLIFQITLIFQLEQTEKKYSLVFYLCKLARWSIKQRTFNDQDR